MSKYVASIPLGDIDRIRIYINSGKLSLRQIVAQEAPDLAITGNFWLYETYRPTCPIKADGKVLATDTYNYPALIWDTGPDISMGIIPPGGACGKMNYIANSAGLYQGKPETMYCNPDVRGRRGRTGWGFCGGALAFIAFPDGDGMEPEELRDYVQRLGWSDCIMGDGGRKVNYYNRSTGDMVQGRDPSQNLILVYKRKGHSSKPDDSDKEDKPMDDITQAIMTNSDCYKAGRTITPKGIMVHSTATPGADAQTIRSAWDRSGAEAAVHYIIDDQRTLQTLPDTCRAWHCGGAANNTHLSFEICEPQECRLIPVEWVALKRGSSGWAVQRLQMELQARGYDPKGVDGSFGPGCDAALRACQKDLGLTADGSCGPATLAKLASRQGSYLAYNPQDTAAYFEAVWSRAVALCVQLCKTYGLSQSDILCHSEGYAKGIASNHADVMHWWPYHSKTMDIFRAAVWRQTPVQSPGYRAQVQARFGLAEETMDYLEAYRYGADLLQKLAAAN
jgi:peptidoglycan hydrolase-like protein with peptidoglycan-binding domain